ncbi:MAG: hypothetical protein EZS28_006852 [Streblomastix strix]|uniref:Uncharacterized protein n=1 Tax=Streblomastix strix TaxID=222440 RepID=A0A5J4WTC4_9EUKA|nr:MAG: hypothetical protein EZS28_006852 [Streblomastix strix]
MIDLTLPQHTTNMHKDQGQSPTSMPSPPTPSPFEANPKAQPLEPILFPKVRIYFAEFPYLHSSIDQRLYTLKTCCGYQYGLYKPLNYMKKQLSPKLTIQAEALLSVQGTQSSLHIDKKSNEIGSFKGRWQRTEPFEILAKLEYLQQPLINSGRLFRPGNLFSGQTNSKVTKYTSIAYLSSWTVMKKRKLFSGRPPASPISHPMLPLFLINLNLPQMAQRYRNINLFPFRPNKGVLQLLPHHLTAFNRGLRTDSPTYHLDSRGTFLRFSLQNMCPIVRFPI